MKTQGKPVSSIISDKELQRLERIVALGIKVRQLRHAVKEYDAIHRSRRARLEADIDASALELSTLTADEACA